MIAKDKIYHAIAGGVCALPIFIAEPAFPILLVIGVGIGKEVFDHYFGGVAEASDAMSTFFGGFVVLGVKMVFFS